MNDRKDLAERLCTLAGMIFEDASEIAISSSPDYEHAVARSELVRKAAEDSRVLADAALVVLGRGAWVGRTG